MESNNTLEIVSIASALVSVILALVAIALSAFFYKMSMQSSEALKKASDNIDNAVNRLDILFNKLYSDTFGIVKDTMTDMREHIMNPDGDGGKIKEQIEAEVQAKVDPLKEAIVKQMEIQDIRGKDSIKQINRRLSELVSASMTAVKEVKDENLEEMIFEFILKFVSEGNYPTVKMLMEATHLDMTDIITTVYNLHSKGKVTWGKGLLHLLNPIKPVDIKE
jgi:hypothetical protein